MQSLPTPINMKWPLINELLQILHLVFVHGSTSMRSAHLREKSNMV